MKLTTEEKQYLEIYLWNDYNEKMVVKKGDLKYKLEPYYKYSGSKIITKTAKNRIN